MALDRPFAGREWNRTYGGSDFETPYSVPQTMEGGYIVFAEASSYGTWNTLAKEVNNGMQASLSGHRTRKIAGTAVYRTVRTVVW